MRRPPGTMRLATVLTSALLLASLAALAYGVAGLTEIGTCASGGPYVSARPCPDGTGAKVAFVFAGSTVYILAMIAASFRSFSAGTFWFGALFTVLGATFLVGEATDTASESGGGVGWLLGGLFLLMGVLPLLGGAKGLLGERREARDPDAPAPFLGPYVVGSELRRRP